MSKQQKTKGFTIIEVVLVLAIAGLIFLMVFIALPALQKSQRDTQRKNDLSRIMVQMTNYSSNNRGSIPSTLIAPVDGGDKPFVQNYLDGDSATVSGKSYVEPTTGNGYEFLEADTQPSAVGQVGYFFAAKCGVDGAILKDGAIVDSVAISVGERQFALETKLENQDAIYCVDNQ